MVKNTKKINVTLFLFVIVAIISELIIIRQNLLLKNKIQSNLECENILSQFQRKQIKLDYENSFEGRSIPTFLQKRLILAKDNVKGINSEFLIVLLFSLDDCSSCLQAEFSIWNAFTGLFDNKICSVVGFTSSDSFQNTDINNFMNIRFPILRVDSLTSKLNEYGIKSTPVVMLVHNRTSKIIYFHLSDTNEKSREKFLRKIESIFEEHGKKI